MEVTLCVWVFVFLLCALFVIVDHLNPVKNEYKEMSVEQLSYIKERVEEALRCKQ